MGERGNAQEQKPQLPGPVLLSQLCDHGRSSNLSGPQLLLPKNPRSALFLPRAALHPHCRPLSLVPSLVGGYRAVSPHPTSWLTGTGAHLLCDHTQDPYLHDKR